jgi:hypothetical protein
MTDTGQHSEAGPIIQWFTLRDPVANYRYGPNSMDVPTPNIIAQDVFERFINQRVIINVFRASHVEAMIARALGDTCRLTNGWEAWDLEHCATGLRLEVKQSAAMQTWQGSDSKSPPSFDIAARKWQYIGTEARKVEPPQRLADIYIFAWHGDDSERCDQRDPDQWRFLVSTSDDLPRGQKSISRGSLTSRFGPTAWISWCDLAETVERTLLKVRRPRGSAASV